MMYLFRPLVLGLFFTNIHSRVSGVRLKRKNVPRTDKHCPFERFRPSNFRKLDEDAEPTFLRGHSQNRWDFFSPIGMVEFLSIQ